MRKMQQQLGTGGT